MVYKEITTDITHQQLRKAAAGKPITLTAAQLKGGSSKFYVHPENHKKVQSAKKEGCGVRLHICDGAIHHDLAHKQAGSIWSWLKGAAESVYDFGKDNWDVIKPVISRFADSAVPAIATAFGAPELGVVARSGLKSLTGVGIVKKGSPEAKARMMAVRAKRGSKRGGSFSLN